MIWDENKRKLNLEKHGFDFVDAILVLQNKYRLEVESIRNDEVRRQTFAYVAEVFAVLTVVWFPDNHKQQIISFRRAHKFEREVYHAWLEKDFTD